VRPSRAEHLVAALLDQIQQGLVRPVTKLPTESELSAQHGVSRTVVREAISRLQAAGIVRTHQGRGSFVLAVPDAAEFHLDPVEASGLAGTLQVLEFRTAVEVEAAGLAALRCKPEQLAAVRAALDDITATAQHPAQTVEADFAFHIALARAAGNPHFPALLESLGRGMLAIPRHRLAVTPEHAALLRSEHAAVHAAVAAGDQLAARASMRVHLVNSAARLSAST
jgi:DNA-binding FadR family transcriptional regulator